MINKNINPIEEKNEKKRNLYSFLLTLLLHIIFLTFLAFFNIKKDDSVTLVKVQLKDKIEEEYEKMWDKEKQKIEKKKKEIEEKIKKETLKKGKEKEKERKQNENLQNIENIRENKTQEKEKITENKDLNINQKKESSQEFVEQDKSEVSRFDKYIEDNKKKKTFDIEKEFFGSKQESFNEEGDSNELDDLLSAIGPKTNTNEKKGSDGKGGTDETTSSTKTQDGSIFWGDKKRELEYSNKINPPKDLIESGLKVHITIEFTVYENGFIGNAKIIESSGKSSWDEEIKKQFMKNYKFVESKVKSKGTIQIYIGY